MSDEPTPERGRLREHVAEEIRVLLARRKMSATQLARLTGLKQSSLSRRMTGETAFDMDDLEVIADVLGVSVTDLMPQRVAAARDPKSASGQLSRLVTPAHPAPAARRSSRPSGRTSAQRRPVSVRVPGHTMPTSYAA